MTSKLFCSVAVFYIQILVLFDIAHDQPWKGNIIFDLRFENKGCKGFRQIVSASKQIFSSWTSLVYSVSFFR
jgi:hypothetical protein